MKFLRSVINDARPRAQPGSVHNFRHINSEAHIGVDRAPTPAIGVMSVFSDTDASINTSPLRGANQTVTSVDNMALPAHEGLNGNIIPRPAPSMANISARIEHTDINLATAENNEAIVTQQEIADPLEQLDIYTHLENKFTEVVNPISQNNPVQGDKIPTGDDGVFSRAFTYTESTFEGNSDVVTAHENNSHYDTATVERPTSIQPSTKQPPIQHNDTNNHVFEKDGPTTVTATINIQETGPYTHHHHTDIEDKNPDNLLFTQSANDTATGAKVVSDITKAVHTDNSPIAPASTTHAISVLAQQQITRFGDPTVVKGQPASQVSEQDAIVVSTTTTDSHSMKGQTIPLINKEASAQMPDKQIPKEVTAHLKPPPASSQVIPRMAGSLKAPLAQASKRPEPPRVHIGQIDVIIETPTQPRNKQVSTTAESTMASRHYLRRL